MQNKLEVYTGKIKIRLLNKPTVSLTLTKVLLPKINLQIEDMQQKIVYTWQKKKKFLFGMFSWAYINQPAAAEHSELESQYWIIQCG